MWKPMFRGFLAHKFRLALTTLSVVLGVGFVAGTYVLTDTMNAAFDELFDEITSRTDVVVRAKADFVPRSDDRRLVPERLLPRVRGVEGVAAVEGGVDGFAQIVGKDGEPIGLTGPPTLGVSISRDEEFQVLTVRAGRRPVRAGEMAVDARTAADNGIAVRIGRTPSPSRSAAIGAIAAARRAGINDAVTVTKTPRPSAAMIVRGKIRSEVVGRLMPKPSKSARSPLAMTTPKSNPNPAAMVPVIAASASTERITWL